jgi:predicted dehydrogenase
MMHRIAVVGCGRIAPAHLEGLKLLPERAQVAAICDVNEELRSERQTAYGVSEGFSSVEELLNWGEFDTAAVLTPPDVRADVCLPILKAGKHMMVEKPFNHSLEEAWLIVETAEDAGVTLAVNQNFRWIPPAPRLRECIISGSLGRVLSVTLMDTVWRDESKGWRNKTDKLALSVMGVHWLDRLRWITGDEADRVYTDSLSSGILTSVGEDITSTVISFRSGAVATLVHHWASRSHGVNNSLQVDGTDGSVIWSGGELLWMDKDGGRRKEKVEGGNMPSFMAASWTELMDAIDEVRLPHHSGRDNLWTVALLEGAYRSAAEGRAVRIDGRRSPADLR